MVRREIVDAVVKGEKLGKKKPKKSVVVSSLSAQKADFQKISQSLNLTPGSARYQVLESFCENKKPCIGDTKTLIHRIKDFNDAQLTILKAFCTKADFTVKNILATVQSIKKFGDDRLLMLRCFVDLGDIGPGQLHQFFRTALPCGTPKEMGKEAYKKEVLSKHIRPDQIDTFYNICHRVDGVGPGTAVAILPKIRELKQPHARVINSFLSDNACFGDKPIDGNNILSLINLWLSLPVPKNNKAFEKLITKLSGQPKEKKNDFMFLIHTYKTEVNKMDAGGKIATGIRNLLG